MEDAMSFLKTVSEDKRTLEMFRYLVNRSYIRVVNYHNTRQMHADRFESEEFRIRNHGYAGRVLRDPALAGG